MTIFTEIHIDGTTRAGFLRTVPAWPSVVVLTHELVLASLAVGAGFGVEMAQGRLAAARPSLVEEEDLA